MALSFEEVNVLGNLINDTFGKYSTQGVYGSAENDGDPRFGGYSSQSDNSVVCKAQHIVAPSCTWPFSSCGTARRFSMHGKKVTLV